VFALSQFARMLVFLFVCLLVCLLSLPSLALLLFLCFVVC